MARSSAGSRARNTSAERRNHERVAARVPMNAVYEGRLAHIEASNICEGGAYCQSAAPFEIMTRIEVSLEFPPVDGGLALDSLRVEAVVVRCEPHLLHPGLYNLALFFPQLEDTTRERIARFVRSRRASELPDEAPSGGADN